MARNPIQFQSGLSLPAFLEQFGTEAQCQAALFQHRWPRGFVCPDCGNNTGCRLSRGLYRCHRCHHQTSLTSGTLFHAIRGQHAPRYLVEFEYLFNRRYDLKAMIPRLLRVAARTLPMLYRFLKMADSYA